MEEKILLMPKRHGKHQVSVVLGENDSYRIKGIGSERVDVDIKILDPEGGKRIAVFTNYEDHSVDVVIARG